MTAAKVIAGREEKKSLHTGKRPIYCSYTGRLLCLQRDRKKWCWMRWGGRIASYRWSTQTFFLNHTRLGSAFSSEVNSAFVVSPWTWQLKRRRRSLLPEQRRQMTARTKKWAVWSPRTITSKFPFKELIFSRLFVQEAQEIRSKTWHQGFGHKMLRGVYIEFWKQVL